MSDMMKSPESLYELERKFNKQGTSSPPQFGVCLSGGGHRSAAFAMGVLRGLHERKLLRKVDVISAVSGGSYALSWLLLQPFYHKVSMDDLERFQGEMLDFGGPFQRHLEENAKLLGVQHWLELFGEGLLLLPFDAVYFNVLRIIPNNDAALLNKGNISRKKYREGIQKAYQFPPASADKQASTSEPSFDEAQAKITLDLTYHDLTPVKFPELRDFALRIGLPSFVINTTVVPPSLDARVPKRQRIFELGSIGFGSDSCGYLTWNDTEGFGRDHGDPVEKGLFWKLFKFKHKPGEGELLHLLFGSPYATIRNFNVASAMSGAIFSGGNIEGWKGRWLQLLNLENDYAVPSPAKRQDVVWLSDGGHSENLGAYALLRRKCRTILIVDAEYDPLYKFDSYLKLKEAVEQDRDLGIKINVPIDAFTPEKPIMEGETTQNGNPYGKILYIKLSKHDSLLGDQAETINSYAEKDDKAKREFPHESTVDQYFDEDQFKAYRALGYAITRTLPNDVII